MGLPGQAAGKAISDLIYGKVNPSGRLAEIWPCRYEDVPSSEIYGKITDALYQEGLYVGYRYYDKSGLKVRWPFGHGLSYTSFTYSGLQTDEHSVTVTVKNTGKYSGAEVVQLYISPPQDSLHRPLRKLKGFCKVFLEPMESKTVTFKLNDRSFVVWQDEFKVPAGCYTL